MDAYEFILCLTLLSSSYGLSAKNRISNLEMQVGALTWQTKQDIIELRDMIESLNTTDNSAYNDIGAQCSVGVKCADMQAVVEKMEVFMDEQNERFSVLQTAFFNEKFRIVETMKENKDAREQGNEFDEEVKETIKELDDRLDTAEIERSKTNVKMTGIQTDLTAMFQELNAKVDKLAQTTVATTVKPRGPPCSVSWLHQADKCYLVVKNVTVTWEEAKKRCNDYGGILADPDTEEAMLYLLTRVGDNVWIGATDEQTEGRWIFVHSKKPVTYLKWGPSQPNNYGGDQDCMEIYNASLNDEGCGQKNSFVCQKNVN